MSAHATTRTSPWRLLASGGLALTLALASTACSDDDEGRVVSDVLEDEGLPTQPAAPETSEPLESAAGAECVEATDVPEFEGKPTVEMPVGEVITELGITDITEGDGAEATAGMQLTVNYVGIACSTGMEFDTSWVEGGMPFDVVLGQGSVIAGWDEGLVGMKAGGLRQLDIPAEKAYGAEGRPPSIAPDEALTFVIELLEVGPAPEAPAESVPAEGETPTESAPAEGETPTESAPAEGEATDPSEPEG